MDGRYLSPEGPVDERVLVIRFIFHNPERTRPTPAPISWPSSLEVVNYLVAHRFADELGVEEEIWFLEYHQPQLAIWRKDAGETAAARRVARAEHRQRDGLAASAVRRGLT